MSSYITYTQPIDPADQPLLSKSYSILLTDSTPEERHRILAAPANSSQTLTPSPLPAPSPLSNDFSSIPRSTSPTTVLDASFYDTSDVILDSNTDKNCHLTPHSQSYHSIPTEPPPTHRDSNVRCTSVSFHVPQPQTQSLLASNVASSATAVAASAPPRKSSFLGTVLVLLSAVTFASNAFLVRVAEARFDISTLAVSFVIFGVTTCIAACYIAFFVPVSFLRTSLFSRTGHARLLFVRGVCGALASACCYRSYDLLPVGDAVAIYNVCPGLTTLTALAFLGEGAGALEIVSLALGLCGAYLVANPSSDGLSADRFTGAMFALGDAAFSALAYTTVRFLGGKVHFSLSVGVVGLMGTAITAALGGVHQLSAFVSEHPDTALYATAAAIAAAILLFVAQSLLDKGLQYCPAGRAMLLRTLEVPFAYAFGMAFLAETPSTTGIIGSGLVVTAASVIALGSKR